MEQIELKDRPEIQHNEKLSQAYTQFNLLLVELSKKNLPDEITSSINAHIENINDISDAEKELKKGIKNAQSSIIQLIEKKLRIVPINHYRKTWTVLGLSVFGLPLGVVFGTTLGNMAFIGIGLPIGMAIGAGVGAGMDKKAAEQNRQLSIEINQ